ETRTEGEGRRLLRAAAEELQRQSFRAAGAAAGEAPGCGELKPAYMVVPPDAAGVRPRQPRPTLLARTTRKTMARWASNDQGSPRLRVGFGHAEDRQGVAVVQRDFDSFADLITAGEVERDARERGSHFEAGKAGGAGGRFAGFEDLAADAAASEI